MNERAKNFSQAMWIGDPVPKPDGLHIYSDGIVLYIRCTADRHLAVRDCLLKQHPGFEEARGAASGVSVFVVPMDVGDTDPADLDPLFRALSPVGYSDHRQSDYHLLEDGESLITDAAANARPDSGEDFS